MGLKLKALKTDGGNLKGDVFESAFSDHELLQKLRLGLVEKQADNAKLVRVPRPKSEVEKLKEENAALKKQIADKEKK